MFFRASSPEAVPPRPASASATMTSQMSSPSPITASTAPSSPLFHDIRLHSHHKNTIIVKGSLRDTDLDPVLVQGSIVFGIRETTKLSRVRLKLIGVHNVHFVENFQTKSGKVLATCPFQYNDTILTCEWDNLLTKGEGVVKKKGTQNQHQHQYHNQHHRINLIENNFHNIQTFRFDSRLQEAGTTPFPHLNSDPTSETTFELPPGNYSLPFSISLPGNIAETVESLKSSSIVYHFESTIETFHPQCFDTVVPFTFFKYVRVIRTLSSMQLALNEDFLAENSWTKKLQYKIRIPRKLLPIGSTLKIFLLMLPVVKSLKLGKITIQIAQHVKLHTNRKNDFGEDTFANEKIIYHQSLPQVPASHLATDVWALEARLPLPNSLRYCSPDVETMGGLVTIKHKLIIFINLVNNDGHVSQIKSKIPIGFYIQPGSSVLGRKTQIVNGKVTFINKSQNLFDVTEKGSNSGGTGSQESHHPELFVSACDIMNPDQFLFNDAGANEVHASTMPSDTDTTLVEDIHNEITFSSLSHTNYEVPPSYTDSNKDIVFEPDMFSRPGSPLCVTPLANSSTSLSSLTQLTDDLSGSLIDCATPSYNHVYDDDTSDIGEPTPVYEEYPPFNANFPRPPSTTSLSLLKHSVENRRSTMQTPPNGQCSLSPRPIPLHTNSNNSNVTQSLPHTRSFNRPVTKQRSKTLANSFPLSLSLSSSRLTSQQQHQGQSQGQGQGLSSPIHRSKSSVILPFGNA